MGGVNVAAIIIIIFIIIYIVRAACMLLYVSCSHTFHIASTIADAIEYVYATETFEGNEILGDLIFKRETVITIFYLY